MNIILYSDKVDEYLKHDNVIDYDNESIIELAGKLYQKADDETAPILIYHGLNGVSIKNG